jgi:hypothetical protein
LAVLGGRAAVIQWLGYRLPKPVARVRIPAAAPSTSLRPFLVDPEI